MAYYRGGISDKHVIESISDRIRINIRRGKKRYLPKVFIYYFLKLIIMSMKRRFPMDIFNKLLRLKKMEYTEIKKK